MSRRWDRGPETEKDRRFFTLRESGYRGPIDQDGKAVKDLDKWVAEHGKGKKGGKK